MDAVAAAASTRRRRRYAAGWMMTAMTWLEKQYAASETPFLQGELTMADLFEYMVVDMILQGQFDYVPASYMDQFPQLMKTTAAVKAHPVVAEYLSLYPN